MIDVKSLFKIEGKHKEKIKVKASAKAKAHYREVEVGGGKRKENKYGFKTNLTESEIKDRKRLGKLMIEADREINKFKDDPIKHKEYKVASEKYRKAQEELYNKYGVY